MMSLFLQRRPGWACARVDDSEAMRKRIAAAERGAPRSENDRRIAALKNRHAGRIGWLLGNGPSVRVEDLERLAGEVCFGCNRLYLAYDTMDFRPTYLCSSDRQMIADFGQEMVDRHPGTVCFVSEEPPKVRGANHVWFRYHSRTPLEFSPNAFDFVMPGGGTLITAMQIGFHMGITRFYLYGVDHNFSFQVNEKEEDQFKRATGDDNHFIKNYRSGKAWCPPVLWQIEASFLACHVFLRQYGGWVKNATRGGKLDILERIEFDEAAPPRQRPPGGAA